MGTGRLDKWIASQGKLSRKQVKELIASGQVAVNGKTAVSPEQKAAEGDVVVIGGKRLTLRKHMYIMMNKPAGVLSATSDKKEKTVLDLVPEDLWRPGLFPVGRLDKDTEGLLLLTNDGAFSHDVLSPVKHVPKTYFVRLDRPVDEAALTEAFARGLDLGGGDVCSPAELTVLDTGCRTEVEVTIYEGMYHQVKRMFSKFGVKVLYLKRIRMGGLPLDPELIPGECREVLPEERALVC